MEHRAGLPQVDAKPSSFHRCERRRRSVVLQAHMHVHTYTISRRAAGQGRVHVLARAAVAHASTTTRRQAIPHHVTLSVALWPACPVCVSQRGFFFVVSNVRDDYGEIAAAQDNSDLSSPSPPAGERHSPDTAMAAVSRVRGWAWLARFGSSAWGCRRLRLRVCCPLPHLGAATRAEQ